MCQQQWHNNNNNNGNAGSICKFNQLMAVQLINNWNTCSVSKLSHLCPRLNRLMSFLYLTVVSCCQFDLCRIVSGSADNTVRIWYTGTGECAHVLEGHEEEVVSLNLDGLNCFEKDYIIHVFLNMVINLSLELISVYVLWLIMSAMVDSIGA